MEHATGAIVDYAHLSPQTKAQMLRRAQAVLAELDRHSEPANPERIHNGCMIYRTNGSD